MSIFKSNKTVVIVGFLFSVIFTATLLFHHLQSNTVEAQNQDTLTFQAATSQNRYLQLEPISLSFKLTNHTTIPIKWNGMIIDETLVFDKDVNFLVSGEGNNVIRYKGVDHSIDMITAGKVSQVGETLEVKNLLSGQLLELLFPQPGNYQLQCEFTYRDFTFGQRRDVTIVSNPVAIEITEPRGRNRLAYNYLKNIYEPVTRRSNVNDRIQAQQNFVNNFSDSVYGKYLTFNLANDYMMSEQYEKAEDEFYKISDIDFYYSKQVDKQLGKLTQVLGRPVKRTKRPPDLSNAPVAIPMPAPTIVLIPLPNNPPVPIPIPNPNPNRTPSIQPN